MRLIMQSTNNKWSCNLKVDKIEKRDDVVFAYRCPPDSMVATEFVGVFDLAAVDFLYINDEKQNGA